MQHSVTHTTLESETEGRLTKRVVVKLPHSLILRALQHNATHCHTMQQIALHTTQERETVGRLTKRIVAKLLHGPISHLRTMDNVEDFEQTVKSFEQMFKM